MKGIRFVAVCVYWIFGQFVFVSDAVEHIAPKMDTKFYVRKDDTITVMSGAININRVNQHHKISTKHFPIEFDMDEYIKHDYLSISN